jgi:hypothetical protein
MNRVEIYTYINTLGRKKSLTINWDNAKENKYCCIIRDLLTSEVCGYAYKTKEEIEIFLNKILKRG